MRTRIIAEIGCNHNGNLNTAKKMVEAAAAVGADAAKFQTFWNLGCLKEYEFDENQWIELKKLCDYFDIEFMSTPHWGSPLCGYKDEDYTVIDFVDTLVKTHKVASPYLTNEKYVEHISSKGKPLLVSTGSIKNDSGMATISDIAKFFSFNHEKDVTLMHCVSKYPPDGGHYERINELKMFGVPVGLSDHTKNFSFPNLPVIEKHFKLDDNCVDANVSLNPKEFANFVNFVRGYEKIYKPLEKK